MGQAREEKGNISRTKLGVRYLQRNSKLSGFKHGVGNDTAIWTAFTEQND